MQTTLETSVVCKVLLYIDVIAFVDEVGAADKGLVLHSFRVKNSRDLFRSNLQEYSEEVNADIEPIRFVD